MSSIHFKPDLQMTEVAPGVALLQDKQVTIPIKNLSPGLRDAISQLMACGSTEEDLNMVVQGCDGDRGVMRLAANLQRWNELGFIARTLYLNEQVFATFTPVAYGRAFEHAVLECHSPLVLSRFALLRTSHDGNGVILESPLSKVEVRLRDPLATQLVMSLASPQAPAELLQRITDCHAPVIEEFLTLLIATRILIQPGSEDATPALRMWEFHDLLFHSRTRQGRHANGYGGTYRFRDSVQPLPAVKPAMSDRSIALTQADVAELRQHDVPFTSVIESRTSVRQHGKRAITAVQLGEFLYRAARLRGKLNTPDGDVANHPYPGGGALYELELYPIISACEGIDPGVYHYESESHRLEVIDGLNPATQRLVEMAQSTAQMSAPPQILIVIASRFGRLQWKYESLSYALTLKHVGVLQHQMYLIATAMQLAPCALGGGDSDVFATATRLNYYEESSVGEFLLGTLPE